ncbi:MAG: hypothetical protein ACKVOU_09860 [Cytophagales bacterium]
MNNIQLFLFFSFIVIASHAQILPIELVNETIAKIDKADDLIENARKMARKALSGKNINEAKLDCSLMIKLAEEAEKIAGLAEMKADEAEQSYYKKACNNAASKVDDSEDYCRHLGYYTHEMVIYSKKALNEKDNILFKSYLGKVLEYAAECYESIKNAKINFEDAVKEAEQCEN